MIDFPTHRKPEFTINSQQEMISTASSQPHPLRDAFLSVFKSDVRNNILSFSQQLWECDSDVFFFMARKAACFFDCLRQLGITDVRGEALSDRVLDMDLSFVRGKSVTLVDDCIFTGTTLYRAKRAVEAAGCSSVKTLTLAVNKDTIRNALLPGNGEASELSISAPLFSLNNADCVRQNYDIVRAISIIPRPYDVDFPHSVTTKVSARDLERILTVPGWTTHDASSDFQIQNNVRRFTILPSDATIAGFCSQHGVSNAFTEITSQYLPVAKIRVYARLLPNGAWSVRLVPMVIMPPTKNDDTFNALTKCHLSNGDCFSKFLTTPASQYRFLHFLIATSFLHFFASQANDLVGVQLSHKLRKDLMEMSFQAGVTNTFDSNWDETACDIPKSHIVDPTLHQLYLPLKKVVAPNPVEFVAEALAPFVALSKEREKPMQAFVRENGLSASATNRFEHADRLIEGYMPESLLSRIEFDWIDTRRALSVLLDRIVDLGIAVPTITAREDYCSREIRHGEDAIFGPAQERLLMQALKAYMEKRGLTEIWGLELQKFVVLFVQIGIRKGILESLNFAPSLNGTHRIVSVKGHLHGPVPTLVQEADVSGGSDVPYIDGNETHPSWIVDHLIHQGNLSMNAGKRGKKYSIREVPEQSIGTEQDIISRQIGRGLGAAIENTSLNHDTDLVLLSTCAEPDQQLRALCGEIAIFRARWRRLRERVLLACKNRDYSAARKILRREKSVFTAVNSGSMKYLWFVSQSFSKLKMNVRAELLAKEMMDQADDWTILWPAGNPASAVGGTILWKCLNDGGRWLCSLNVGMAIISYWIVLKGRVLDQFSDDEVTSEAERLKHQIARVRPAFVGSSPPDFVNMFEDVEDRVDAHDVNDADDWCEMAGRVLLRFTGRPSHTLLASATQLCNSYGTADSIRRFPHAVFVDVPTQNEALEGLYTIVNAERASLEDTPFCELPEIYNPWKRGSWTIFSGNRSSDAAVVFAFNVTRKLRKSNIRFRAAVVAQLSSVESVQRLSTSTTLDCDWFASRLADLRPYVLSESHDDSIGFANDVSARIDEVDKFCQVAGIARSESSTEVSCGNETFNEKTFRVARTAYTEKSVGQVSVVRAAKALLLCTATDLEDDCLERVAAEYGYTASKETFPRGVYRRFDGKHTLFVARSSMGSGGSGGAIATVMSAIDDVQPANVISCGLAFGSDAKKQSLGDILVAQFVQEYEKQRVGSESTVPRGGRFECAPSLLQIARLVRDPNLAYNVHTGLVLSGEKLVDNSDFKEQLWRHEPEAIGGEMEGAGVVAACQRNQIPWILIKAICDWGESKDGGKQLEAATNAFDFVLRMIDIGNV